MIKAAIEKIADMLEVRVFDKDLAINGLPYSTKTLLPICEPEPSPILCTSLTGLVELLSVDGPIKEPVFFHVFSHKSVSVYSCGYKSFMRRTTYATAIHENKEFPYNQYLDIERFNVGLQTFFVFDAVIETILKLTGNLVHEASITTNDNGFSQTVTAKTGIARTTNVVAPSILNVRPYRTFLEVEEQPNVMAVLRFRQTDHGAEAGLFESDSGLWKLTAIESIKQWLNDAISISCIDIKPKVIG